MSLKDYLPPDDPNLTLEGLLHGYAVWWQSQPSRTKYARHYSTDNQHDLLVWEGHPGSYDYYGDFEDDNHFYNHVVLGYMIHFHIRLRDNGIGIAVYERTSLSAAYNRFYKSLSEMRQSMIDEWEGIEPSLGEGGQALRDFIAENADDVVKMLQQYGARWVKANKHHHSLVYRFENGVHLCLWSGQSTGVHPPAEHEQSGAGVIDWSQVKEYAEIRVSMMRIPVRFDLEQRTYHQSVWYSDLVGGDTRVATLHSFSDLQHALPQAMRKLKFFTAPE